MLIFKSFALRYFWINSVSANCYAGSFFLEGDTELQVLGSESMEDYKLMLKAQFLSMTKGD